MSGEKANIITTKYDIDGNEVWQETYNSGANDNDYGTAIEVDASGNVYIAAASYISNTNNYDYRVIKYNSSGTLQWNVTYNGPGNFYDVPTNILVDGSGNVYVTGGSFGTGTGWDYCTIKYNSSGTAQWTSRYNYNSHDDVASGLALNSQGKILVTGGSAQAVDNWDFASLKYNPTTGSVIDEKRNTASGLGLDQAFGFAIDYADNLYITGRAAVSGQGFNMRTVKLDSLLTTVWTKTFNLANLDDEAHGIVVDESKNVYITGFVTTADSVKNYMTLKYNVTGALQWSKQEPANNGSNLDAEATDIAKEEFGYIYVTGKADNGANLDIVTYMYATSGNKLWMETFDGGNNGDDIPYFVNADINNQFYVGGKSYTGSNYTYTHIRYKHSSYIMPPDDDVTKPSAYAYFPNKGQLINTNNDAIPYIKYYSTRHYPALYFDDDTLHYVFSHIDTNTTTDDTLSRIAMTYYGSSTTKQIQHVTSQGGEYLNYYLAHTGNNGITNVQHTDKLFVGEVYPKVDALYYFDGAGIKYYLIIKPGYNAQVNPIKLQYDGATASILSGNKLKLETDIGEIIQKSPDAYQISSTGSLISLAWDPTYTITSGKVGFTLGTYDMNKTLVIEIGLDKLLGGGGSEDNVIWSTVYGSGGQEMIVDNKYSHDDLPIILGSSKTDWFPEETSTTIFGDLSEMEDIFINKFDVNRASLFGTIIGGSNWERPRSLDVQLSNEYEDYGYLYVVGSTLSYDFYLKNDITTSGHYFEDEFTSIANQAFMFRLSPEGNYIDWSTFVKGILELYDIDFDNEFKEFSTVGRINNTEEDWPLVDLGSPAFFENDLSFAASAFGFIMTLNKELVETWGTKFWGAYTTEVHYGRDVLNRLNIGGYITDAFYFDVVSIGDGGTAIGYGGDFGGGELDPFFATFTFEKELIWATPFGGDGQDYITGIASDQTGNVYYVGFAGNNIGETTMTFPTYTSYLGVADYYYRDEYVDITDGTNHSYDGFIIQFDNNRELQLSTLFGGDNNDKINDITFGFGLWFCGSTNSEVTSDDATSFHMLTH